MALILSSSAFADGERIPRPYSCEGADMSPPLHWKGAPAGTKGWAMVCSDPDAPMGTWYHWAVFDIPPEMSGLPESYPTDARVGETRQAVTDFGHKGYGGPCPPKGHGEHRYRFVLSALDVDKLPLPAGVECRDVEAAAREHAIMQTVLTGVYSR